MHTTVQTVVVPGKIKWWELFEEEFKSTCARLSPFSFKSLTAASRAFTRPSLPTFSYRTHKFSTLFNGFICIYIYVIIIIDLFV